MLSAQSLRSPLPRVVSPLLCPCAPPIAPAPPTHHVRVPMCTALSMTIIHTPSELFSPCMQENIESDHCCRPHPSLDHVTPCSIPHTPQCMYCMFAFDECVLSFNLASITSQQYNLYSISSFFSSRTPSAPSVSPRAIATHTRVCFTHLSSLFRYYYTLLLSNQPASLTQSCSHSSFTSTVQHPSPVPPLLPTIDSMHSELS